MSNGTATARAHANIALIKYWGKRDQDLNLPQRGSLSLTLQELQTDATVRFDAAFDKDSLQINGEPAKPNATARVRDFLDLVRASAGLQYHARVDTSSNFPTASGLASSASAFAALALAATSAAGLRQTPTQLSVLARRGSGSAARSIFGGLVRMHEGKQQDGLDSHAEPIATESPWPLRIVVAIVNDHEKEISSRDAMLHCQQTSPLHDSWVDTVNGDLDAATVAIANRDLHALGALVEASAFAMHGSILAARPAIRYWQPTTLACLAQIESLRRRDIPAFATIDAGPHVKALTDETHAMRVAESLKQIQGIKEVRICSPGRGAERIDAQ